MAVGGALAAAGGPGALALGPRPALASALDGPVAVAGAQARGANGCPGPRFPHPDPVRLEYRVDWVVNDGND